MEVRYSYKNYDWLHMLAWLEFQKRCLLLLMEVLLHVAKFSPHKKSFPYFHRALTAFLRKKHRRNLAWREKNITYVLREGLQLENGSTSYHTFLLGSSSLPSNWSWRKSKQSFRMQNLVIDVLLGRPFLSGYVRLAQLWDTPKLLWDLACFAKVILWYEWEQCAISLG